MRRAFTSAVLLLLVLAATIASAAPKRPEELTPDYSFDEYIADHGKPHVKGTIQYAMRQANFKISLARVLEHNSNPKRTYLKGINAYSDWMEDELKALRGARHEPTYRSGNEVPYVPPAGFVPAAEIDYRKSVPAVLTAVKDQGYCGDCWAHATTEAIESAYAIATGRLLVLSQQQVTSCTPAHFTCYSCNGSFPRLAYDFVAGAGPNARYGLVEEWRYPFESYTGAFPQCHTNLTTPANYPFSTSVQVTGYKQVAANNQSDIIAALNTLGPLSILVDASGWNEYAGGVFTGCAAFGPTFGLDHAVMLVGYGHDSVTDLDYWIVRNSWSAGWGEGGYIRIARSASVQCGINVGGLSCNPAYTGNVTACGPCGMFTDVQFPIVNVSNQLKGAARRRVVRPKASELTAAYTFPMYVQDFGKTYKKGSAEWRHRRALFNAKLRSILKHNADPTATWKRGVNRFTDATREELSALRGARHEPTFQPRHGGKHVRAYEFKNTELPSSLDYRKAWPRVLTSVKDQGACGDCWAHSTTEAIESSYARATGKLLVLSQQQITSCTPAEGSCYSCQGMYPRFALEYASDAQYIMEEWVYPFTSYTGTNPACTNQTNPPYPVQNTVQVAGYTQISPNRQEHVMEALATLGPLMILVDASAWDSYESGVFSGCSYGANASFGLDHAVQLVGYGYDATVDQDYWIVRNSWSAGWGEEGFIRLQKTAVAECGLNLGGMSCFASANNTQPTPSCGMCGVLSDAQFPLVSF